MVTDYSFISEEAIFIVSRFLNALSRHLKDTNDHIEEGFIYFALRFDPA